MRPFRLLLLLSCFVALPIFLTCISLFSVQEDPADSFRNGNRAPSRLRALFTFHTPSSLFPPSALISLTYDNSTFFLARPAAFGPSLPSKGLSGQLWVGKGFGEELLDKNGDLLVSGWELGCSDVPDWDDNDKSHNKQPGTHEKPQAKSNVPSDKEFPEVDSSDEKSGGVDGSSEQDSKKAARLASEEDGTDDHLHYPLSDSSPAKAGKPGEPANIDRFMDKTKKSTHADIESLQESAAIAGKIVLLSRGGCGFLEKVKWTQRRGGIALVVGDNERGAQLTIMYAKGDTSNVTIPAIFTSYTSAHLLSSLVPPELATDTKKQQSENGSHDVKKGKPGAKDDGPIFTSIKTSSTPGTSQPTIVPADFKGSTVRGQKGWAKNVMSVLGGGDGSPHHWHHVEDSRRPPSSGSIDWVLVEDWVEEDVKRKTVKGQSQAETKPASSKAAETQLSSAPRATADDFVIGVQDWRDADLVAPKPGPASKQKKGQQRGNSPHQQSSSPAKAAKTSPTAALKGGSITPGSGEYDHQKQDESKQKGKNSDHKPEDSPGPSRHWIKFWHSDQDQRPDDSARHLAKEKNADVTATNVQTAGAKATEQDDHHGLWVTLTPTSVSTSPFFDTLLVLVVSPLVTLTMVYALLLLRSRIRRRRWRAPKSVVERLPVRTYHTLTTSSSTTSSQLPSPNTSNPASPLLHSVPQDIHSRPRPRSQTTTGVVTSASAGSSQPSLPVEKSLPKSGTPKRKRYVGRQVECVVCLEEYVDGESRVMSLPCGHEFHAECITPWLVTRRRTCPICKGDVVRSLARSGNGGQQDLDNGPEPGEETADDVQDQVVETVNNSPSAAIPIPVRDDDEQGDGDVERGDGDRGRDLEGEGPTGPISNWRNIVSNSLSRLSGDTVWRSTTPDRSR